MRAIYPDFIWRMPDDEKVIYLTFDDGPIPEITEFVLEELAKYQAKATFFCIGGNIEKHPDIFQQVINQGHTIGNHTFNHLRGWNTENEVYLENFWKCEEIISMFDFRNSISEHQRPNIKHQASNIEQQTSNLEHRLFRPPFGRIKRNQAAKIIQTHKIIMWDVLSGDYDQSLSQERVLNKSIKHTENGSIVLFHDSIKASKNMQFALPKYLEHFSERGFTFKSL